MRINFKWAWTLLWALMVFILFAIYTFSQADAVDIKKGYVAAQTLPPGTIIGPEDILSSENVTVNRGESVVLITDEELLIGKKVALGFAKGEPITTEKIQEPSQDTSALTIPAEMGNVPHPVESLKVADIWIDYNPRDYPDREPEKIAEKIPVKSVRNRKTTSVTESDDKVPALVVVETTDKTIARIRDYSRMGSIFFTNPFPDREVKD